MCGNFYSKFHSKNEWGKERDMEKKSTEWKKFKKTDQPVVMYDPYLDSESNKKTIMKTKTYDTYTNYKSRHLLMIACNHQFL